MKQSYVNLATDKNDKVLFVKVTAYSDKSSRKVFEHCVYKVKKFQTLHSVPVLLEKRLTKPFNKYIGVTVTDELLRSIRKEYSK